jgi:signal transduction histidine kinase
MASQAQEERGDRVQEWFIHRALDSAAYATLVLSYLITMLAARHLTTLNFSMFTFVNVLYGILAWRVFLQKSVSQWWSISALLLLGILTFASGLLALTGLDFNWLLYFVTVSIYFTLLPIRQAIIAGIILFLIVYINVGLLGNWQLLDPQLYTLLSGFIFVAAFSYSNQLLVIQRRRTEQVLRQLEESRREREEAHEQLQAYANEVEELTIDRERARLAREIHDTLGHYLTILTIQLETISKLQERDPERAAAEVAEARRVAAQSMQEVRNAVAALRPTSIATLSLPDALTQLASEFNRAAPDIALTLDLETQLPALSPDQQLALYRAAQEALTNIRKHAQATKILLRLRYEDDVVELLVLDNGLGAASENALQDGIQNNLRDGMQNNLQSKGADLSRTNQPQPELYRTTSLEAPKFPVSNEQESSNTVKTTRGGFGLLGLRERIELLGGRMTHGPAEPTGYRLSVSIPLPAQHQVVANSQVQSSR